MSMMKLAFQNFKSSFKSYLSLIISLAFTILVLFNFINLIDSGILDQLGESNARNVEIILQVLSFTIACFMIFFIWYSTNVFLTKRKKEIGIYVFMGLSNQKIGKLYAIETILIGFTSLLLGIVFGIITSQLFTMILMAISEISVEITFHFSLMPMLITSIIFFIIYFVFVVKGYINIVRSSVLEMVSANRQNEYVKQNNTVLILKAIIGVIVLAVGFYLATKEAGMEVMGNILLATILVIIGIYLLFGGLIPLIFQTLAKNKNFLYQKERNLWINNIIFRMKKNYRTYAIVCVLMLCSVTALAFGFSMKNRYEGIVHFENTYTYQVMSDQSGYENEFKELIEKENKIEYASDIELLTLNKEDTNNNYTIPLALVSYSDIKQLADDTGMEFDLTEPKDHEYIKLNRLYVMSLTNDFIVNTETIQGVEYTSIQQTTTPYLGYMQEEMDYMIVNDKTFTQLSSIGQSMHIYNYKIEDSYNFEASTNDIQSSSHCLGLVKINPERDEIAWLKILFSVSIFTFMVFIFASGSILFMKLYNDAFEEKERYQVLSKLGISKKTLKKSIANELRFAYAVPFLIMAISSYFSVKAIGNLMQGTLLSVNIISVIIIFIFFYICYRFSLIIYQRNVL